MKPGHWLAIGAAAALSLAGGAGSTLLSSAPLAEPAHRHKLTRALDEISGLATTPDGRLLAHEDQSGIVYELDAASGEVTKTFSLGNELRGDFEGIAAVEDVVYLVTSTGKLVRGHEGADGEQVAYEAFDTGVAERCREVEGLAFDPEARCLVLACKRSRDTDGDVLLFRWSVDDRELTEPLWRTLAHETLTLPGGSNGFRASGLARDARSGHWLLLSASPPAVAELTADAELLEVRRLSGAHHRQPEGIAVAPNTLWIADEGAGKRARLAAYRLDEDSR